MAEDGYPVKLHIYDLSQGMARQLSATILGKAIEAIWHTGVVVYGREYYFGGGIQQGQPGRTPYGAPVRVEQLGVTHVPREVFEDFLREIGPRYTPATYNLLSHNCNNFSNEAAQFLAGAAVPSYILDLPSEVMSSPVGALILPMIQGLETSLRAGAVPQPPQLRPAAPAPAPAAAATATTAPGAAVVATQPPAKVVEPRSAASDKADTETVVGSGGTVAPPAVQPAAAVATKAAPVPAVQPAAALATKAAPQAPAVASAAAPANVVVPRAAAPDKADAETLPTGAGTGGGGVAAPPAVQPAAAQESVATKAAPVQPAGALATKTAPAPAEATKASAAAPPDPLTEAKARAQEEIKREFAAIMATGTARAGEAAALATRRVMERHGLRRAASAMQRG